jgi:transcriptional regulator with XRE-family HTH domain
MMQAPKMAGRPRPQNVDRYVGARMRERRIMLGLSQQQMAELIGVTYQQAHKYEKGINRVAAGRLHSIAQALGVEIGYFFDGLQIGSGFVPPASRRMLLDLARSFLNISDPRHREAVATLARALAESKDGGQQAA